MFLLRSLNKVNQTPQFSQSSVVLLQHSSLSSEVPSKSMLMKTCKKLSLLTHSLNQFSWTDLLLSMLSVDAVQMTMLITKTTSTKMYHPIFQVLSESSTNTLETKLASLQFQKDSELPAESMVRDQDQFSDTPLSYSNEQYTVIENISIDIEICKNQ